MPVNKEEYLRILEKVNKNKATLVAVSKTRTVEDIRELYDMGQRDFGENYVQELLDKKDQLPGDVRWHFIGHLQSNKARVLAPFIHLIHGVDSIKLLEEINKQGAKLEREINVLLQVHIAKEDTKFGMDAHELNMAFEVMNAVPLQNVSIRGLMGMATFTTEKEIIKEFKYLYHLLQSAISTQIIKKQFSVLSMGMSADYELAMEEGSNMVRIGSLIFANR